MRTDAIGHHDDSRRKAAGMFVGSCICQFCRTATVEQIRNLGPRLIEAARLYADAETAGMARVAKQYSETMIDILKQAGKRLAL